MAVETSTPVTAGQFFDRHDELQLLGAVVDDARQGVRRWLALLGHRKIGKTSLLLELMRRHGSRLAMPYVDCWEVRADALQFVRGMVQALIRATVRRRRVERVAGVLPIRGDGGFMPSAIQALARLELAPLDEAVRLHEEMASGAMSAAIIRRAFELPGLLAAGLGESFLVILDEFQELDRLRRLRRLGGSVNDVFGLLRSVWQRQEGVSYVCAGSRLSLLHQILTEEKSPFFQHFEILRVSSFRRPDSTRMVREALALDRRAAEGPTVSQILDILGDHPFYVRAVLQEATAALTRAGGGLSGIEGAMREALEAALFDASGRLHLFMEQCYRNVVGDSSTLESVLRGFVEPARITDVATSLHMRSGAVSTAVRTLLAEDVLVRLDDGRYGFADRTLALWLKHQVDFRQAMPPLLIGTESERVVAQRLAADGFRGVYQSRASRGSFDLLAIHDARVLGLQVKTASLPCQMRAKEMTRLREEARRLGFRPVLALVVAGEVRFYDLHRARRKGGLRIRNETPFESTLLALL